MEKLRAVRWAFVCGLLSTPAFAQLTTIGPDTPGVTESVITLQQTSVVNGLPFYSPVFTKVPLGSLPGGSDDDYLMVSGCFDGCIEPVGSNFGVSVFDVTFSKPVSMVSVLQMGIDFGDGAYLAAFGSSPQAGGTCFAVFDPPQPAGCSPITSITEQGTLAFLNLTVSDSVPDITQALISGADGAPAFGTAVRFSVTPVTTPEPGAFALFATALAGLAVTRRRWAVTPEGALQRI